MTNEQILAILKQIESSNGQNFNHPVITHGVNSGTQAIGNYGLTNGVLNDVAKQNRSLASLGQMSPEEKKAYLESHPDDENTAANQIVQHLQDRLGGDPNKIAYAWNHGTSLGPNDITPDKLETDQYTNKFQKLQSKLGIKPNLNPIQENVLAQTTPSTKFKSPDVDEDTIRHFLDNPNNPFNEKNDNDNSDSTNTDDDEDDINNKLRQYVNR